jgi:hypothetical protein
MADSATQKPTEAARLEAALERIAKARVIRPATASVASSDSALSDSVDRKALAGRLDQLIAEIRAALGRDTAD